MMAQECNKPHTRLDINFHPAFVLARYRVFLDDKELFDCAVADAEQGYVERQRRHPLFKNLMRDRKTGKVLTRRCEGVVRIEVK